MVDLTNARVVSDTRFGAPGMGNVVATCPQIQGIGIAAGRVIVMSFDGTPHGTGRTHVITHRQANARSCRCAWP